MTINAEEKSQGAAMLRLFEALGTNVGFHKAHELAVLHDVMD